jgi:plastocyanin
VPSYPFYFAFYYSSYALVSPGSFTEIVVLSIGHGLAANPETVALNATAPSGITVSFSPSSKVQLQPSVVNLNVTLTISASNTAAVGNDTITVNGVSGTNSQSAAFTLRVVQNRVVILRAAFTPHVLNVTTGSTVYWQNLDGPIATACTGFNAGTGIHSVVFTTIPRANSSAINQFQIYSYTFTKPGSYFYYSSLDTDHSVNGTINVVAPGGAAMGGASIMPAFSYFKGGTPAMVTVVPVAAANPARQAPVPAAADGRSLGGPGSLRGYSPTLSALSPRGVQVVLFALGELGVALAVSLLSRRTTALGLTVLGRSRPQ